MPPSTLCTVTREHVSVWVQVQSKPPASSLMHCSPLPVTCSCSVTQELVIETDQQEMDHIRGILLEKLQLLKDDYKAMLYSGKVGQHQGCMLTSHLAAQHNLLKLACRPTHATRQSSGCHAYADMLPHRCSQTQPIHTTHWLLRPSHSQKGRRRQSCSTAKIAWQLMLPTVRTRTVSTLG